MRNGFFSALFLGLLVLGGLSLVLSDWNGMFQGSGITKTDIAVVNGTPIKIAEFNTMANRVMHQQRIDPATAYESGLIDNILQSEILSRILGAASGDYGLNVEDKHVAKQVSALITPLINAETDKKQALQQFLRMQGMNEKDLVKIIRQEMQTDLLKSGIAGSVYVPAGLEDDLRSFRALTKTLQFVRLENKDITVSKQADDKTLEDYYKSIQNQYMTKETRDISIAILDVEPILNSVTVSDSDIQAAYDERKDDFSVGEERRIEQAIVAKESDALSIANKAKAKTPIKDALKSVTKNTKGYTENTSFSKEDLTQDIATPLFTAKEGDVVGPVKSALGYHVIRLVKITPAHTKSLDEVKEEIKREIVQQRAGDEMFKITSEIEDRLASGEDFQALKKEYGLKTSSTKGLRSDSESLEFPDIALDKDQQQKILQKSFQMKGDEASSFSELTATSFYSVRIDHVTPSAPEAFSDVKDMIRKRWTEENQARANLAAAQKLADDLNAGKMTLEKSGHAAQTIKDLTRTSEDLKDPRLTDRFMEAADGKYILAVTSDASAILVGKVSDARIGKKEIGQDDNLVEMLASDSSTANMMLFVSSLEKKYPVRINRPLIERTYAHKSEQEE